MANHKTKDIPGRIKALGLWKHGREATTAELAQILKEDTKTVASALGTMKVRGEMEQRMDNRRAYWKPSRPKGIPKAITMPWLRPAGVRLLRQLKQQAYDNPRSTSGGVE